MKRKRKRRGDEEEEEEEEEEDDDDDDERLEKMLTYDDTTDGALLLAAKTNNSAVVKLYLNQHEMCVNINITEERTLKTAIMYAAIVRNMYMIRFIVTRGARINQRDSLGNTAVSYSVIGGHCAITHFLVRHGGNRFVKNKNGKTSVDLIPKGNNPMKELLLGREKTIFEALLTNDLNAMSVFLGGKGRLASTRDNTGRTLMEILIEEKESKSDVDEMTRVLLKYGAKKISLLT
ncbi:MAG: ankyrin repeat domain-containing protein [Promethearchaeota archaeon]